MGYDMYVVDSAIPAMPGDEDYYRLNIFGMQPVRERLFDAGAVHERAPMPNFPDAPDDGNGGKNYDAPEFQAAVEQTLSAGCEYPGIPIHKLCSNDGWHVTPLECKSATAAWREYRADHHELDSTDAECDSFINWIERAGERGGFKVY